LAAADDLLEILRIVTKAIDLRHHTEFSVAGRRVHDLLALLRIHRQGLFAKYMFSGV
jgi:hypothetical protein